MSFIIRRGYAEVQILKQVKLTLSLEPFGTFWYPNSEKSKTEMDITHFHV